MPYQFIDVNGLEPEELLPAEAMCFNGLWLEQEISGYRTLYVRGRESVTTEISELTSPVRDGEIYRRRRKEGRNLYVGFQLCASSPAAFRSAFNKLGRILSEEGQVQIIFNDEPDKYFIGTAVSVDNVPPGRDSITAEITIHCSDPFKYAVEEQTVTAQDGEFSIDYNGGYKCYPVLTAQTTEDLGYIGYLHENGAIIQIGDPDEADGVDRMAGKRQDLVNSSAPRIASDWTSNQAPVNTTDWPLERALVFGYPGFYGNILYLGSGTEDTSKYWHGGSRSFTLPADSAGEVGAQYFRWTSKLYWVWKNQKMMGAVRFIVRGKDADNRNVNICEFRVYKNTIGVKSQIFMYSSPLGIEKTVMITNDAKKNIFGASEGEVTIAKELGVLKFITADKTWTFRPEGINDYTALSIHIAMFKCKAYEQMRMGILRSGFSKLYTKWVDTPNKIGADSEIVADCSDGTIKVDGSLQESLGASGNNWEEFVLVPGPNRIQCVCSSWAEEPPTYTMRYREVFI